MSKAKKNKRVFKAWMKYYGYWEQYKADFLNDDIDRGTLTSFLSDVSPSRFIQAGVIWHQAEGDGPYNYYSNMNYEWRRYCLSNYDESTQEWDRRA